MLGICNIFGLPGTRWTFLKIFFLYHTSKTCLGCIFLGNFEFGSVNPHRFSQVPNPQIFGVDIKGSPQMEKCTSMERGRWNVLHTIPWKSFPTQWLTEHILQVIISLMSHMRIERSVAPPDILKLFLET